MPSRTITLSSNKLYSKIYQQKTKKNTVIFCDNLLHSLTGINHLINNLCNGDTIEFYDFNETEENTNTKILITSNKFLLSEKYKHIYFIPNKTKINQSKLIDNKKIIKTIN